MPMITATFLMSDVESSTRLWESQPHQMRQATELLDSLIEAAARQFNGTVVKERGEGDSHFVVFSNASDAVGAAVAIQDSVRGSSWPTDPGLKLRVAVHTGEVHHREGDYYGPTVNRCARIRAVACAGQVLVSGPAAALCKASLPEGARLSDLGNHRLRDLLEPIRIFQLSAGAGESFPPLRSLRSDQTNLPMQLTSFVGREAQIADISTLLETKRILTLVGPGGSGKTRLALQVGAESSDRFEDGVWFVSLVSLTEPGGVASTAAAAMGLSVPPSGDPLEAIASEFAKKRALVILDNCEHLGDEPARFVGALVKACPDLSVMATSRRGLGLAGEALYNVPPLEVPDLDNAPNPDRVGATEAVRLLLERAKAKAPEFKFGEANAWQVGQLCASLEGMPLAIELAAPKLRLLSPDRIVQLLREDLGGLEAADLDVDPRHRTLRSAIAWSFAQLSEETRRALCLLACFPAGFTLQIAESVLGARAISTLEELIDNSLVQPHHESAGEPRYRILETIRQYAEESCDSSWLDEAAEKRYAWALALARSTKPELVGPNQESTLAAVHAEYDNLRATLEWAEGQPAERGLLVPLAANLDRFWHRKGLIKEGLRWLETALSQPSESKQDQAITTRSAGVFCNLVGNPSRAQELLATAVQLLRALGAEDEMAGALVNAGIAATTAGSTKEARKFLREALTIYSRQGDRTREALVLQNLATLELDSKRFGSAERALLRAKSALETLDDKWGLATTLGNLGSVYVELRRPELAVDYLRQSLSAWIELGDAQSSALVLKHMATLAEQMGHAEMACRLLVFCRELRRRTGFVSTGIDKQELDELLSKVEHQLPEAALRAIEASASSRSSEEMTSYALDGIGLVLNVASHI